MTLPVYPDYANNRTSNLVVNQVPEFVAENYPNFVSFLQAYYEWMELNGNPINQIRNFPNYLDIDYVFENNLNQFVNEFQQTYMASLPSTMLADKAKVLKNIKQFYSSRGTPKSFEFLFRILFNQPVEVNNPGTQILRASAGKWYQPTVLRILPATIPVSQAAELGQTFVLGQSVEGPGQTTTVAPLSDWVNTQILGQTSFASAVVNSVTTNFQFGVQYDEFVVSNVTKQFLPAETIEAQTVTGEILTGTLLGIVPGISITNPGSKYNVGDPVIITGGGGANANAFVSAVSSGSLQGIFVADGGSGFQLYPNFLVNITGSQTPTSVQITNVDTSGAVSPNTYTFNSDALSLKYNTIALAASGNTPVVNTWNTVTYGNCGPIVIVTVFAGGSGYVSPPGINVTEAANIANTGTVLTQYGTIGTLKIINAGINYHVNDDIKILNVTSRGVAGAAQVTSVNAAGSITGVYVALPSIDGTANVLAGSNNVIGTGTKFSVELFANNNVLYPNSGSYITVNGETHRVANIVNNFVMYTDSNYINTATNQAVRLQGFPLGGMGYLQSDLPNGVVCIVNSTTGSNAIIQPDSVIGSGAQLSSSGGSYGLIENITMRSFGDHYSSQPSVSFPSGDGTATGIADVISAQFSYPGYFLNEDGMLSARRYLEDPHLYNTYTYTLKSPVAVQAYQALVQNILHPAGSNLVGITTLNPETPYRNANSVGSIFLNLGSINLNDIDINFVLDYSTLSGVLPGKILGVNFIIGFSVPA